MIRPILLSLAVPIIGIFATVAHAVPIQVGAGSDITATSLDTEGEARVNVDRGNTVMLPAGTYNVVNTSIAYSSSSASGELIPFLATATGASTYETLWVADPISPSAGAGIHIENYTTESLILTALTEVFAGVYLDGTARVFLNTGINSPTDHDNSPTIPSFVGQTIGSFSHPGLARTYAFEINVEEFVAPVPEPTSLAVWAVLCGVCAVFCWRRRGSRADAP